MAQAVPPLPYKTPFLDQNGFLSGPWAVWFREMFNRIGGTLAPTNTELGTQTSNISGLQTLTSTHTTAIAALQASVTALQGNINDLNQGPEL